jgi:hypothetical protein
MIEKFSVFNPLTGEHNKFDSKDSALKDVVSNFMEFYKQNVHGVFYNRILVDESGMETWCSEDNGTELPQEYIDKIKDIINK